MGPSQQQGSEMELVPPQVERARRTLWIGLLVFRWAFFVWMVGLAIAAPAAFDHAFEPMALVLLALTATGAWTLWLTVDDHQERSETPYVDLALAVGLILVSSLVVLPGEVSAGKMPFFAVAYPSNAALLWGAAKGPKGGVFAGLALSLALVLARPLNEVDLTDASEVFAVINGAVYYVAAGTATGVFSLLFARWAVEFRTLTENSFRIRERATKVAERESIAREIHDSVLHALLLIIRRGAQLIDQNAVSVQDVQKLTDMAREQERALRAFVVRAPEEIPEGQVSMRERLERVASGIDGVPVAVSAAVGVSLPAHHAEEIAAAVEQALDNVVKHSGATRAAVFLDAGDDDVIVSVRDNGVGFVYEESSLTAAGKAGILGSMKGRVADLGGRMRIETVPGLGTEVEFRVPVPGPTREEERTG